MGDDRIDLVVLIFELTAQIQGVRDRPKTVLLPPLIPQETLDPWRQVHDCDSGVHVDTNPSGPSLIGGHQRLDLRTDLLFR